MGISKLLFSFVCLFLQRHIVDVVYGHLQRINLQRASLYGPPKYRQLVANAASRFVASGKLKPLATLPVAAGNLQLYQNHLAAFFTTCSDHSQRYQPLAAIL